MKPIGVDLPTSIDGSVLLSKVVTVTVVVAGLSPNGARSVRLLIDGADQHALGDRAREVIGLRLVGVGADWLYDPPRLALVAHEHDVAIGVLEFNFRDVVLLDVDQLLRRLGLRKTADDKGVAAHKRKQDRER